MDDVVDEIDPSEFLTPEELAAIEEAEKTDQTQDGEVVVRLSCPTCPFPPPEPCVMPCSPIFFSYVYFLLPDGLGG